MTFDEFVTSVTNTKLAPKVVDTVLGSNVLTLRLIKNARPFQGRSQEVTVKVSSSSSGGSYDGYDLFSTSRSNTRQKMSFPPKGYYQSVVMSGMEVSANASAADKIDLVATEMESAQQDMIDGIGDLFYGDGTGNSSKDFTGLAAAVDDGSVAASYGGLSRSTFTTLQANVTTGVGNITLSQMATMYDSCQVGSDKPTLIVTTPTIWSYYEELLQPTVAHNVAAAGYAQATANGVAQNQAALSGDMGFDALFYRGTPIVKDEKCTSGYMYFLNEKYLHWYSLRHHKHQPMNAGSSHIEGAYDGGDVDTVAPPIAWTGLKEPVNQDAEIGQFLMLGELINRNPNRSGVLQGITGV